ncbi:MAG: SDR family oxidoreductase [Pseudomonadota bacterium]
MLIHTARAILKKPVAAFADAEFERLLNENTRTTFDSLRDGGLIVAIGTSLTAGTSLGYATDTCKKSPADELTRMIARELDARGITVNHIAPYPLDNSFSHTGETPESSAFGASLAPSGGLGTEADIVPVVTNPVAEEGGWTNGQTLFVNGSL